MPVTSRALLAALVAAAFGGTGCAYLHESHPIIVPPAGVPHELAREDLAAYIIEPPDILQIELLYAVPKPPYKIKPLDILIVRVKPALPDEPLDNTFPVDVEGKVNLGPSYGSVAVAGLTLAEAKTAVETSLKDRKVIAAPVAEVLLGESRGQQMVRGPHLVRPDGTVSLGSYGDVKVRGMTLAEAKRAIEAILAKQLVSPEVTVDVGAYNSKVFFVILDGGGAGQQVIRLPFTGNDTVLDAVSQVNGLAQVSDADRITLARRTVDAEPDAVFPVDWASISLRGKADTNYQLQPGDRLFVYSDHLVTLDTRLARLFAPIERVLGVTLLGTSAYRSMRFLNNSNANTSNP
jgi:polysaccharide biosynthesis/export protein